MSTPEICANYLTQLNASCHHRVKAQWKLKQEPDTLAARLASSYGAGPVYHAVALPSHQVTQDASPASPPPCSPLPPRNKYRDDYRFIWLWQKYDAAQADYKIAIRRVRDMVIDEEYATGKRGKNQRFRRTDEEMVTLLRVEGTQSSGAYYGYWRAKNRMNLVTDALTQQFERQARLEESSVSTGLEPASPILPISSPSMSSPIIEDDVVPSLPSPLIVSVPDLPSLQPTSTPETLVEALPDSPSNKEKTPLRRSSRVRKRPVEDDALETSPSPAKRVRLKVSKANIAVGMGAAKTPLSATFKGKENVR